MSASISLSTTPLPTGRWRSCAPSPRRTRRAGGGERANFGVYRSTFNGLKHSTGDATLCMLPVDLQDPPEHLPEFVKLWESGYDVVAGALSTREEGFVLRSARAAFYRIINWLSDFELSPDVGEFQLVDRKVLDAVLSDNDHCPYIRGIIASVGFKKVIIPIPGRRGSAVSAA
ncbi:MAG: glycosyltransferase [Defluviimonas denitrificans]